jgi:hypothetical protein
MKVQGTQKVQELYALHHVVYTNDVHLLRENIKNNARLSGQANKEIGPKVNIHNKMYLNMS